MRVSESVWQVQAAIGKSVTALLVLTLTSKAIGKFLLVYFVFELCSRHLPKTLSFHPESERKTGS